SYTPSFLFSSHPHHRHTHSFPTRRSSDLKVPLPPPRSHFPSTFVPSLESWPVYSTSWFGPRVPSYFLINVSFPAWASKLPLNTRSEEHTSELQSLRHLVCRLLLEKKNKII